MPDNHPSPHDPELWTDRLLIHPETGVPLLAMIGGMALALNSLLGYEALITLPLHLGLPLGLIIAGASSVAMIGVLVRRLRHLEQHGWHILITACAVLVFIVLREHDYGTPVVVWFLLIPVSVGILRAVALALIRKSTKRIHLALKNQSNS